MKTPNRTLRLAFNSHPMQTIYLRVVKEVNHLLWKAALMLFVLFFATTATIVVVGFNAPSLHGFSIREGRNLKWSFDPLGDPIDSPGYPG